MSDDKILGRRDMLRRALVVIAAAPVMGSALASCGGGELSCTGGALTSTQLITRNAVHYAEHGPDASRHCSGCQLYTGSATACGTASCLAVGL